MGDVLVIRGSISSAAGAGSPSGDLADVGPLEERLLVGAKVNQQVILAADAPYAPALLVADGGPFANGVNVLHVKTVGGKVRVRVTTSDGATQAFPVDSYLCLISESVAITAVDFTRVSGVSTTVKLFMAEKL